MRTVRSWTLAALPLLLAACGGGGERTAGGEAADTAGVAASAPADPAAGRAPVGTTFALNALNDSGAAGEATVSDAGGPLQVMVRLTGAPAGDRPGHIHTGTCDDLGPVVEPLQPVTVGADGTGTSTSTLTTDMNTLMAGQYLVSYHGEGGTPIACGQLQVH